MTLLYWEWHLKAPSLCFQSSFSMAWYLEESWQVLHDRLVLWRCLRGFLLPILEYCSVVWCSAANTHIKLVDRVVSGASFLTGGVFECDLAHRHSMAMMAVLCMLYKIRCNPLHPLYGALPMLVRVTGSTVIAHWYTYVPPCCRTSQYSRTFIPFSVSLWTVDRS